MVRKALSLLAFFLPMQSGLAQAGEWKWISPAQPLGCTAIAVAGNRIYFTRDYVVSYSSDGGETIIVPPPYAPTNDAGGGAQVFAFADSLRGFLNDGTHGALQTTDGGLHWMFRSDGLGPLLAFGSSNVGWQIGPWKASKSYDGGDSWVQQNAPFLENGGIFSKLFCLGESMTWVAKSFWYDKPTEGSIWRTTNGGDSWSRLSTGVLGDSLHQLTFLDLGFVSSGRGFAIGVVRTADQSQSRTIVFRTSDFGSTWESTDTLGAEYVTVKSITDSTWILYGTAGNSLTATASVIQRKTSDGGRTWSPPRMVTSPNSFGFRAMGYLPALHTIVVATLGEMWKSTDAGESYTRVVHSPDIFVKSMALDPKPASPATQAVVAASYDRNYLLSLDAGRTWAAKQIPPAIGNSISEFSIAERVMYVITDQMKLWKSTDLGLAWTGLSPVNSGGIHTLSAFDGNTIAVQGYPNLIASIDGGVSWTYAPYGNYFWWKSLTMLTPNEMIAVGEMSVLSASRGFIYHTTDRGHSWRIEDTPSEMAHLCMFSDLRKGFAVGTYQFYKTTNGGKSWLLARASTDYYDHYGTTCFRDSLYGLMQNGYFFLETTDGGTTWTKKGLYLPVCCEETQMAFTATGNLLVASYLGFYSYLAPGNGNAGGILGGDLHETAGNSYSLAQNFPNPFNPSTKIRFTLRERGHVRLSVFNTLGQQVAALLDEEKEAGFHEVLFDGSDLPSGVYFYRVVVRQPALSTSQDFRGKGSYVETKKLLLLR